MLIIFNSCSKFDKNPEGGVVSGVKNLEYLGDVTRLVLGKYQ